MERSGIFPISILTSLGFPPSVCSIECSWLPRWLENFPLESRWGRMPPQLVFRIHPCICNIVKETPSDSEFLYEWPEVWEQRWFRSAPHPLQSSASTKAWNEFLPSQYIPWCVEALPALLDCLAWTCCNRHRPQSKVGCLQATRRAAVHRSSHPFSTSAGPGVDVLHSGERGPSWLCLPVAPGSLGTTRSMVWALAGGLPRCTVALPAWPRPHLEAVCS